MPTKVASCTIVVLDGVPIEVKIDVTCGLPATVIIGLLDAAAVQKTHERVQNIIKNSDLLVLTEDTMEVTYLHFLTNQLSPEKPPVHHLPFLSPYHTVNYAGLAGGGRWPKPCKINQLYPLKSTSQLYPDLQCKYRFVTN